MTAALAVFSTALLSAETQWPPRFQTYEEFAAEWKLAADEWPPFGEWMHQVRQNGLNVRGWSLPILKERFVQDTEIKLRKAHGERFFRCSAVGWVVGAEPPTEKEVRDKAQRLDELRILQRHSTSKARFSQITALEKEVHADQERRWCAEQDGADAEFDFSACACLTTFPSSSLTSETALESTTFAFFTDQLLADFIAL